VKGKNALKAWHTQHLPFVQLEEEDACFEARLCDNILIGECVGTGNTKTDKLTTLGAITLPTAFERVFGR